MSKREIIITNTDKIFWPKEKYTKGDMVEYYKSVSRIILPYLKNRPESLHRHPDGIKGSSFFQKNVDHVPPDWVETVPVRLEGENRTIRYLVCQNKKTLAYMNNLGVIELNPWNSRIKSLRKPDYLVIDLDPEKINFDKVVETAHTVREVFKKAGIEPLVKTSGATGMHVMAPLGAKYDYQETKNFARLIAALAHEKLPKTTSLERMPVKRQGKVYLDFLQNRKGQTITAPYSLRPRDGAPVSTPLRWSEVKVGLNPNAFNINNTVERLNKVGDIWKPILGRGIDIKEALKRLT